MHALVHILSRRPLTYQEVERIMDPYYEGNVYRNLPDEKNDITQFMEDGYTYAYPQSVIHPQFTWDYYTIQDEIYFHAISDCYVLIDPDGYCISREWWNGKEFVDQRQAFENYIQTHLGNWVGKVNMIEVDIHW